MISHDIHFLISPLYQYMVYAMKSPGTPHGTLRFPGDTRPPAPPVPAGDHGRAQRCAGEPRPGRRRGGGAVGKTQLGWATGDIHG